MNYTRKLMVEPGAKVRLARFDPAFQGKHTSEEEASRDLAAAKQKIGDLQRKMYGDNRHSLLIVLQKKRPDEPFAPVPIVAVA